MDYVKSLVRITKVDVGIKDHGLMSLQASVEYENGTRSGFPDFVINTAFLYRIFACLGVSSVRQMEGKSFFFLYEPPGPQWGRTVTSGLVGFAPLHKPDGTVFMLGPWIEWSKENCAHSAYEEKTGKKP